MNNIQLTTLEEALESRRQLWRGDMVVACELNRRRRFHGGIEASSYREERSQEHGKPNAGR